MESNTNMKKKKKKNKNKKKTTTTTTTTKTGVLLRGLNAMPFRTEARKCNHGATGGLLELGSKFNGTYIHMKCRFY